MASAKCTEKFYFKLDKGAQPSPGPVDVFIAANVLRLPCMKVQLSPNLAVIVQMLLQLDEGVLTARFKVFANNVSILCSSKQWIIFPAL